MELQGEDGSVVELSESLEKELGRGPGFAPHDRTVSRRQVRLQVQRIAASKDHFRFNVLIEVIGPNPICVIHSNGGKGANNEVEIAKSGTQSLLEIGDKFSLSIQEPVFYTLQEPVARVGLGPRPSGESGPRRNGNTNSENLLGHDQSDANDKRDEERNRGTDHLKVESRSLGIAGHSDEEEGIAEAVARWQRRKQERLQVEQRSSTQEGGVTAGAVLKDHSDRIGEQVGAESKQGEGIISQQERVYSKAAPHDPPEANDPELTDGPRTNEDDADLVKKFGFVVEGSEFECYGKKGLDTSKWDWQIGRRPANDSDDDEDEEGLGFRVRPDQTGKQQSRVTAGSKIIQKAKRANDDDDDDDDDWRGDNEGEKELLSVGKRPVPRKKVVQTRSHDYATTSEAISEPTKKQKLISTKKVISQRKSRATKEEDDDGENLDGFLVDNVEEEDEPEVADDEDEWTDEDEDEEVDEDDEIDKGKGKGTAHLAGHAPAPSRPVKDNELNRVDDNPLCKYGNKCFRKNKDHLAQFRH